MNKFHFSAVSTNISLTVSCCTNREPQKEGTRAKGREELAGGTGSPDYRPIVLKYLLQTKGFYEIAYYLCYDHVSFHTTAAEWYEGVITFLPFCIECD